MLKKFLFFSLLAVAFFTANVFLISETKAATTIGENITSTGNLTVQNADANAIFFVDNNNQRIGIGTTTPAYKLTIESDNGTDNLFQIATSTNQNIFLIDNKGNIGIDAIPSDYYKVFVGDITAASSKTNLRSYLEVTPSGSYPMYNGVESIIVVESSAAEPWQVTPVSSTIYHSGTNKIRNASGFDSRVTLSSTGDMEDIYNFRVYNELGGSATPYGGVDAGNVTNLYGFYFYTYLDNNSDVTNSYGVYLDTPDVNYYDANITNNYGIYIGNQVKGLTQNYAIYTDGGDWLLDADGGGTAGGTTGGGDIIIGEGQDLEFYHDGTNSYIMNNTGDLYISDASTDDVILSNNGGNVGIATTTPGGYFGEKLTVVGNTYTRGTATTTGNFIIGDGNSTATTTVEIGDIDTAACIKARDANADGWTYCYFEDGAMVCSTTNVCGK